MAVTRLLRPLLLSGAMAAACAATPAPAQQTPAPTPAPAPAPAPQTRRPTVITLPGAEGFELRPSGQTPAPSPAPAPAPTVTPPPIAAPTPTPTPGRAAPAARPSPAATRAPAGSAPTPTAAALPTPTPAASPLALPTAVATTPAARTVPAPPPAPASGESVPWTAILGGLAVAALGILAWLWTRRRPRPRRRSDAARRPVAAPRPVPPPPAPKPVAAPPPPPVSVPSDEPVAIEFRPIQLDILRDGVVLEYELLVGNPGPGRIEDMRISLGLVSASPTQDDVSQAFHFAPPTGPVAPPFALEPGKYGRLTGRLVMEQDQIHVVQIGGRPVFVPFVLVNSRWRGGLSIRRHTADFMAGIAGQGGKIGPVWLDRGASRLTALAASRYFRKSAVQAAE